MQLTRERMKGWRGGEAGMFMNSEYPTTQIAPHCHLSTTANQLVIRTKSDIIPNLTIVNVH